MEWKKYFGNRRARRRVLYCGCAIAAGLILAFGISDQAERRSAEAESKPELVGETDAVSREMGEWIVREGYRRLMKKDHRAASDAAKLAAFFGAAKEADKLLSSAQSENSRLKEIIESEAKDAADAGDFSRQARAESIAERISSPVDDARAHLRAGNFAQARASLLEAADDPAEKEEAQKLLHDMEKHESAKQNDGRAENLFREGLKLKEQGDFIGARMKFDGVLQLLHSASAPPTFAGALEDALEEVEEKLKSEYLPRLSNLEIDAGKIPPLPLPEKAAALLKLKEEIEIIIVALPSEERVVEFQKRIDGEIKKTAENWISAAMRAEGLSGCEKAATMYGSISKTFSDADASLIAKAEEGLARCEGAK